MFGRFRRVAVGIFVVCIFHLCPLVTGFRPGDFSLFNVSQVGAGSSFDQVLLVGVFVRLG